MFSIEFEYKQLSHNFLDLHCMIENTIYVSENSNNEVDGGEFKYILCKFVLYITKTLCMVARSREAYFWMMYFKIYNGGFCNCYVTIV